MEGGDSSRTGQEEGRMELTEVFGKCHSLNSDNDNKGFELDTHELYSSSSDVGSGALKMKLMMGGPTTGGGEGVSCQDCGNQAKKDFGKHKDGGPRNEIEKRLQLDLAGEGIRCSFAEIAMRKTVYALIKAGHLTCVQQQQQQQQLDVEVRIPSVSLSALMKEGGLRSDVSRECLDCLVCLCNLFPKGHVIDGDTLVI